MTFAAISTAIGESGIGIVRMSGDSSFEITRRIFKGSIPDDYNRKMLYGKIIDGNEEIDEVLVCFMEGPKTYTTEDMVEIFSHGGIVAVRRVFETVLKYGARIAEPGEFTKTAFLGGRIDLSQAEAVQDLISAKTDKSFKASLSQLEGKLSAEIKKISDIILEMLANIEATIDYPEEDLQAMNINELIERLNIAINMLETLISSETVGKILRDGITTVILGKPNVGKSSLMNAILGENRSIVTDIPGTTRDTIEELISIDGIPVKLVDTAGIRETKDEVEKIGVDRAKGIINEADLLIGMFDITKNFDKEDKEILSLLQEKKSIALLNKIDLKTDYDSNIMKEFEDIPIIKTSMKEEIGLDELSKNIKEMFFSGKLELDQSLIITNLRHKDLLNKAYNELLNVKNDFENNIPVDFLQVDLRAAWSYLAEITGDAVSEDIINKIFSDFCLGK
ncbi:MAG: tRNA uridine-5-carboxymethylaminomethyl(34) synthesis GTPase MnmE [Tissierellia bacterium]|nr:tRNA uridine-5-carboxymethylaminomethyl(34) synthesis GTPase MnmE [Tissierellia bacterium]